MGFVMDGGEVCQIINRAPAQISFEARITGKAAHAGVHPEKGINAIQVASEAISWMKIGRVDKETTSNVGLIDGGTATNIVPDSVLIKGEARSRSKAKLKKQIRGMTKALAKACRMYRASMRIKVDPVYKSFKIRESSKIIEISKNAVRGIGLKPKIVPTGGGSDANIFNEMGIPSVILGVGFHNVHTSKEYVSIEDLEKGAELILSVIKQAVANSPSPSGRGKGEGGG
jgi:tripeptide aminopeptidase